MHIGQFIEPSPYEPTSRYFFGNCAKCRQPGLLKQTEVSPDEWGNGEQLYPPRPDSIPFKLPALVEESYREALKCMSADAWLASVVMIRRTLEAVGKDFDATSKTLHDGLSKLREKGVISEELWSWGDQLRFIGNIGAHPTADKVTGQDGQEAMEFLEAILETIYHLRPKFQTMCERRQKKDKK